MTQLIHFTINKQYTEIANSQPKEYPKAPRISKKDFNLENKIFQGLLGEVDRQKIITLNHECYMGGTALFNALKKLVDQESLTPQNAYRIFSLAQQKLAVTAAYLGMERVDESFPTCQLQPDSTAPIRISFSTTPNGFNMTCKKPMEFMEIVDDHPEKLGKVNMEVSLTYTKFIQDITFNYTPTSIIIVNSTPKDLTRTSELQGQIGQRLKARKISPCTKFALLLRNILLIMRSALNAASS